jgi:tRNA-(ms[2]io[6]A)-hydroxylase
MLSLQCKTPPRWLAQVDSDLPAVLIDHAHCEKKAASTAMNFLFSYGKHVDLCREMAKIVCEEMEHFQQVLDLLEPRGIPFGPIKPGCYGKELQKLVRDREPGRAVDRLLIAGLIEARSCERFSILSEHIATRDSELAEFYRSLFESEARHHSTYVRLAHKFDSEANVEVRLQELSAEESRIMTQGDPLPRMHS